LARVFLATFAEYFICDMKEGENRNYNLKIGITHGDYNGVAYELVLKTLHEGNIHESLTPVFFGCSKLVSYFRNYYSIPNFSFVAVKQNEVTSNKPHLYNIHSEEVKVTLGEITDEGSRLGILSMEKAHNAIISKMVDALVCCPIQLPMLKDTSPSYIGNGSYFIHKLKTTSSIQILCNDHVKVTAASAKINNAELAKLITVDYLLNKIRILNKVMCDDFLISAPKIAILAANSVDEKGNFVDGEIEKTIEEANKLALKEKILSFGPYNPSTFFNNREYQKFDVIMSITSQQADTIFSLLNGQDGVIYTAGLPFVVTEPWHYSDNDIELDCQIFRSAMYLADAITKNRRMNGRLRKNAMPRK